MATTLKSAKAARSRPAAWDYVWREGRRDDVAVPGIDLIRDCSEKPCRVLRHRFSEGRLHVLSLPPEALSMLRPSLDQAVDELIEDRGAPRPTAEVA